MWGSHTIPIHSYQRAKSGTVLVKVGPVYPWYRGIKNIVKDSIVLLADACVCLLIYERILAGLLECMSSELFYSASKWPDSGAPALSSGQTATPGREMAVKS